MGMNWKLWLGSAAKSIIAIIALSLLITALSWMLGAQMPGAIFILSAISNYLLNPILLAYAGYVCVKGKKGTRADAIYSGAVAGLFAGFVTYVIQVAMMLIVGIGIKSSSGFIEIPIMMFAAVCGLANLAFMVIGGAVFGMIGAMIAERK